MYWRDHPPPHFHAKYADDEIVVNIETGEITGSMSKRAIAMIQEWRKIHENELLENWHLAEQRKAIKQIKPLE
jgi:hypothetical protein